MAAPRRPFRRSMALAACAAAAASAQHSAVISLPDSLLEPGTAVTWVKKVPSYCEGPATRGNLVYFTEQRGGPDWPVWKLDLGNPGDTGTRWITQSNQSNGLFADGKGSLYAAQKGKIVRYRPDGSVDAIVASTGTDGVSFNQANDLSVGKSGGVYFTDLGNSVYYADPNGRLKVAVSGLQGANGVEWIEEQNAVYVLDVTASQIVRYDIGAGGALAGKRTFAPIAGPDGCDLDVHGNFYVGSYSEGAVHVINANGQDVGKIAFKMQSGPYNSNGDQGNICNCHFGGPENKTLYCTGDGGLFSIRLKVPGRAWPAAAATGLGARSRLAPEARGRSGTYRIDGRIRPDGIAWEGRGAAGPAFPFLNAAR